jgi:hypothetical protein
VTWQLKAGRANGLPLFVDVDVENGNSTRVYEYAELLDWINF